jgi:hypothetical protein
MAKARPAGQGEARQGQGKARLAKDRLEYASLS